MERIDLSENSLIETVSHTSKGNQLKWRDGDIWYKADHLGYEGLSEVFISRLLYRSTIQVPYVSYEPVIIRYKNKMYKGCKSVNFIPENKILIPLERLFRQYTGQGLADAMASLGDVKEKVKYLVQNTERFTGIRNYGVYLTTIMEIDAFFLNDDRHTNNLAVMYSLDTGNYVPCPVFDNGSALLSDTVIDYPYDKSVDECIQSAEAKPFHIDFDVQLEAAEELYGVQLCFDFRMKDVVAELDMFRGVYDENVLQRVEEVIRRSIRRYSYLM